MPERDLCVLVEGPNAKLRPVRIPVRAHTLLERPRLDGGILLPERLWRWDGERAETGQRVFREALPPPPPEPSEKPLYDELVIKKPLSLRGHA